jgi:hypothetical protein
MKIKISKSKGKFIVSAVAMLSAARYADAVTNFIWTGAAGDGNWSTDGNWVIPSSGTATTFPGNASNLGANVVIADSSFDNLAANYTAPTLPLPADIGVASNYLFGNLNLGASNSSFGVYTLSSSFSIGTSGTTITFNSSTGGLSRLGSAVENLSGGNYNGSIYPGTSGVQTFLSNLAVNTNATAGQTWAIGGSSGEVLLDGTVTTTSAQTLTKSGNGELEFNASNTTFAGSYTALEGITQLDYANALGSGTSTVKVSGSSAVYSSSLLTNSGVTFGRNISVAATAAGVTATLGGASGQTNSTWSGNIALTSGVQLTGGASGTTTFSGVISGSTFGTLTGTAVSSFGSGNLVVNPTGISGTSADAATVNTTNSIGSTANVEVLTNTPTAIGTVNFNGTNETIGLLSGNGNVSLANSSGTALTIGTAANSVFTGTISDAAGTGSLIKAGSGTFTLGGASTYGGGTNVSSGTLLVTNTTGSATGTGPVVVGTGGALGGSGIISGPVTVYGTIAPGLGANSSATVLTVGAGSSLLGNTIIDLTSPDASDEIVFSGAANLGGTLTVVNTTGFALTNNESFNVFGFGSSVTGSITTSLPALPQGLAWNTSTLASNGILSIGVGAASGSWASNASTGTWETAGNWVGGTVATGGGQTATFGDSIGSGSASITLTEPETVGTLNFNGSSGGSYTLVGANLTLTSGSSSPALISVNAGNQTVNTPVTLTSAGLNINTSSGSNLTIGGAVSGGSGALTVTAGSSLIVAPAGSIGVPLVVGGTVNFANNAGGSSYLVRSLPSLNVSGTVTVAAGSQATRQLIEIGSGGLTDTGSIDLANNDLVLQGGGTAGLTQVTSLLQSGYNPAGGGNWQGSSGITSSTAASNTTHLTTLGVLLNGTGGGGNYSNDSVSAIYSRFDGTAVSNGDLLIKYTYYGDADLSGAVDGSDYSRIDNGYLLGLTGWQNGDFNYDGVINGTDYTLIDNSYNTQGASLAAAIASPTAEIAGASGISAVPEPTSLGLIGIGTVGLLSRRRGRAGRRCL